MGVRTRTNWVGDRLMNAGLRRLFIGFIPFFCSAASAPSASANTAGIIAPSDPHAPTVNSGWQAGTCTEEPPESAQVCSVATPSQFFEQASGHPNWGFTQFIVKHTTSGPLETPV